MKSFMTMMIVSAITLSTARAEEPQPSAQTTTGKQPVEKQRVEVEGTIAVIDADGKKRTISANGGTITVIGADGKRQSHSFGLTDGAHSIRDLVEVLKDAGVRLTDEQQRALAEARWMEGARRAEMIEAGRQMKEARTRLAEATAEINEAQEKAASAARAVAAMQQEFAARAAAQPAPSRGAGQDDGGVAAKLDRILDRLERIEQDVKSLKATAVPDTN